MPRRWLSMLRNWFSGSRVDRDLDAELRATIDLIAEEKIARGMRPEDARRAAHIEVGGLESVKEQVRGARAGAGLESVVRDVRYAVRMLRRHPGFTVAAVLTLALGIGGNTAIFSVADAVLLKSLPVAAPSELVLINMSNSRRDERSVSYPLFERLRRDPELTGASRGVLSGLVAVLDGTYRVDVAGGDNGPQARLQLVDGMYFTMLGVVPFAGRMLAADDDGGASDPRVVVLSHRFWTARFGSDASIVGSTMTVKGQSLKVLGVAAPHFFGDTVGRAPDMWAPLTLQPVLDGRSYLDAANVGWLQLIGRARSDLALATASGRGQIDAALDVVRLRLQQERTDVARNSGGIRLRATDGRRGLEGFRERFTLPIQILGAVVAVVLLIACANVSNLFLVRAMGRRREIAIRLAIGAGRPRIVRQLVTESVALAIAGGSIGLLLGMWGSRLLLVLASAEAGASATGAVPIALAVDARVLAFTAGVSLLTVLIVGLAPAFMASNVDVSTSFRRADENAPRTLMARVLVVAQVALSMMLLTGAGLFLQTLHNLRARDVGFASDALLEVAVRSGGSRQSPDAQADLTRRVRERLLAVPGVVAASFAHAGFGGGMSRTCCIAVEGYAHQPGEVREIRMLGVGPDYFRAMGVRLKEGRDFARSEAVVDPNRLQVAIVNEAFARRYLGGRSAIGARFGWGDPPQVRYGLEIVGVVRDTVYDSLRETVAPLVYFPSASGDTFVLRTAGSIDAIAALVRREVGTVESSLESDVHSVSSLLDAAVARERFLSRLSSFFGIVAMVLAAIGLYGLLAYGVARRRRELGIRMALGADRHALLASELRAAFSLAGIGLAGGVSLTLIASDLVRSQLFGVASTDPATLAWAACLLVAVAGLAALVPAWRASRVDPIAALRCE